MRTPGLIPATLVVLLARPELFAVDCENPLCEGEVCFVGDFSAPAEIDGPGAAVVARIHTLALESGAPGAQSWGISITSRGCRFTSVTTRGTAGAEADDDSPGLRTTGFESTQLLGPEYYDDPKIEGGVVSAVVLSFLRPISLDPGDSPHDVLRITVEGSLPDGGGCRECDLRFETTSRGNFFPTNKITYNFLTCSLTPGAAVIDICRRAFRRGDPNADAQVNIADSIRLCGFLFLGDAAPPCMEAGDANNDGRLHITDAIALLMHLFGASAPPATPGSDCGFDPPTPPGYLGCESYPACDE